MIPLSSRVPGRASGPSRSQVDDGGGLSMFHGKVIGPLGFSQRREFIGGRAMSEDGPGVHTTWWHCQGWPAPPMVRPPPGPPPSLLWTPSSCQLNRNFGFCFVQF
jgi:hypothetical protein